MKRRQLLTLSLAGSAALCAPAAVFAQGPTLRLVVPYAAGGGVDAQARALAIPLSAALSRSVIVENRAGGSTRIGTDFVRRAPPDGGTVLLMPAIAWIGFVASAIFDYEPWKTLVPVCQMAETPYNFLQTRAGSGLDSWEKVRAHAQRTPGGLRIGGPSAGGIIEYTIDDLFRRGGISGIYAPFSGSGPAHAALLGGTVDMQILPFGDGMGNVSSGATHPIAVSSVQRQLRAPNVPTFAELGIGETLMNTFSLWVPPGTPPPVVAEMAAAVKASTSDPALKALLEDRLAFVVGFKDAAATMSDLASVERAWMPRLKGSK